MSKSALEIKKITGDDFDAFCELAQQVHDYHYELVPEFLTNKPHPYTEQAEFEKMISGASQYLMGGFLKGELVAFAYLQLDHTPLTSVYNPRKICYVNTLGVKEGKRRLQIGRQMMQAAEEYARANDCDNLELHVWKINDAAVAFYEKLGYTVTVQRMGKRVG